MNKYILLPIAVYLSVIWLISIILTLKDKSSAKKSKWRTPEKTLMLLGLFGGALPMYVTMKVIHHKTLHKKFMVGLPLEIILHVAIIVIALLYHINII